MYTDDPIEVPVGLVETLRGIATEERDVLLEEVEMELTKLIFELNHKRANITDIAGPTTQWDLDEDFEVPAKYQLLLLYTQQPTKSETHQAQVNHRKAVENARVRNTKPCNMPKFIPLNQIQRRMMTRFENSHTSLLTLMLTVAYFYPSFFTHKRYCYQGNNLVNVNHHPIPSQLKECDTLRTLGRTLWIEDLMRPILKKVEVKLQAWEKRKLVIEQNIGVMIKTMR